MSGRVGKVIEKATGAAAKAGDYLKENVFKFNKEAIIGQEGVRANEFRYPAPGSPAETPYIPRRDVEISDKYAGNSMYDIKYFSRDPRNQEHPKLVVDFFPKGYLQANPEKAPLPILPPAMPAPPPPPPGAPAPVAAAATSAPAVVSREEVIAKYALAPALPEPCVKFAIDMHTKFHSKPLSTFVAHIPDHCPKPAWFEEADAFVAKWAEKGIVGPVGKPWIGKKVDKNTLPQTYTLEYARANGSKI